MKNLYFALLFCFLACKDDNAETAPSNPNVLQYDLKLSGEAEVPAVITLANGTFKGTYDKTKKLLNYTITYTSITPTGWHFHKGDAKSTGAVVVNIGTTFQTPFIGSATLTTAQETDLLAGLWYLNIHSNKFPNGEIRGALVEKK